MYMYLMSGYNLLSCLLCYYELNILVYLILYRYIANTELKEEMSNAILSM